MQQPHLHFKVNSENSKAYTMSPVHQVLHSARVQDELLFQKSPHTVVHNKGRHLLKTISDPSGTKTSLGRGAPRAALSLSHPIARPGLYAASMTSVFPGGVTGDSVQGRRRRCRVAQRLQYVIIVVPPAVCRGAAGSGAPPLHPSQLSAERCGQRGVDKVFRGLPGPSERSQTLSHAATCPTRDADAEDPAQALCR